MKTKDTAEELRLLRLKNQTGTELEILNFGATIFSLKINGTNVIVGPSRPEDYLSEAYHQQGKYFGATVGRYAGRISKGQFTLDGETYKLYEKNGVHLHGGNFGFSYKFWKLIEQGEEHNPYVVLEYFSPDGEEGYPGNLTVRVKYTLTEENEVSIAYSATTDKDTVVNITNHAYFNLNGRGDVNGHRLQIPADAFLEPDAQLVPTGKMTGVTGTEFDFREIALIGEVPLDTVYQLNGNGEKIFLKGDKSGIKLEVETNQPAVVVYVPEDLPTDWEYSTEVGSERAAVCLETQKFPDAPHHSHFPSVRLSPGETYENTTKWKFTTGS